MNNYINEQIKKCFEKYNLKVDVNPTNKADSLEALSNAINRAGGRLYVIIDEHDSFANKLLFETPASDKYNMLGVKTIQSFFETLKMLAGRARLRSFATGVTNLAIAPFYGADDRWDFSTDKFFADVCGFTEVDIERGLRLIDQLSDAERDRAFALMKEHYNGYLFQGGTPLYDPTQCMFFLDKLHRNPEWLKELDEMTDENRMMALVDSNGKLMNENVFSLIRRLPCGQQAIAELGLAGDKPVTDVALLRMIDFADLLSGFGLGQRQPLFSLMYNYGLLTRAGEIYDDKVKLPHRLAHHLFVNEEFSHITIDVDTFRKATENPTVDNWTLLIVSRAFEPFTKEKLLSNNTTEADLQLSLGSTLAKAVYCAGGGEVKAEPCLNDIWWRTRTFVDFALVVVDNNNNGVLIKIGRLCPKHILFADADLDWFEPNSRDVEAMSSELEDAEKSGTLKDIKLSGEIQKLQRVSTVGEFVSKKRDQALGYVESAKEKFNLRQLKAFVVISVGDRFIVEECDNNNDDDSIIQE